MNKLIRSENFAVEFAHAKRANLFHKGRHFANLYIPDVSWSNGQERWAFNRVGLAIEMHCPIIGYKDSIEEIIEILENWLLTKE